MTSLALIRTQALDFRTDQLTDWLDGLPLIAQPGAGGVVPGPDNVGQAGLAVGVDAGAPEGAHRVTVTGIVGGLASLTVTDPDGAVTGEGVAGTPFVAGGLTLTLTPVQGQPALAVGDTFAVTVLPAPIDLTGLTFALTAMLNARSATVMLSASSAPADGSVATILTGGPAGTVALRVLRAAMARCPAGDYPYTITASDPATGLSVAAFVGTLRHRALPSLQD